MASSDDIGSDLHLFPLADNDDPRHFDPSSCALRASIYFFAVLETGSFNCSTSHYPIKGQVGLTCGYCKDVPTKAKVGMSGALSFPGAVDKIYKNATGAVKR